MGKASNTCVVGSGGVKIAPRINALTIAYLRYFFINSGVISPIFDRTKLSIGNSNTIPKTKISLNKNPI